MSKKIINAVQTVWPKKLPLFVRISATGWAEGGWDIEESVQLAKLLKQRGVDLIDTSTGGLITYGDMGSIGPGLSVFAKKRRSPLVR